MLLASAGTALQLHPVSSAPSNNRQNSNNYVFENEHGKEDPRLSAANNPYRPEKSQEHSEAEILQSKNAAKMEEKIRRIPSERFKEFFCGWASGCIETCILYPKSKLIFRQQLHNYFFIEAFRQLRQEGIFLLYRGVLPPLLQRTTTRSIMFGAFEYYQRYLCCEPGRSSFTGCHAVAAFLSGATEASICCSLERVQVLLQTSDYHGRFRNTFEAFHKIYGQYGFTEFYRGYSLIVLRNGLSNVLFFTLREPIRELVLGRISALHNPHRKCPSRTETLAANFISGAILGASISTLFYPVNVIKNRIQSSVGGPFKIPLAVLSHIWEERHGKIRALYRGAHLNFTRSLLTWGITNSVYELLMRELFSSSTKD